MPPRGQHPSGLLAPGSWLTLPGGWGKDGGGDGSLGQATEALVFPRGPIGLCLGSREARAPVGWLSSCPMDTFPSGSRLPGRDGWKDKGG